MGYTDNHINILVCLNFGNRFFHSFYRVCKCQWWCNNTGKTIFPKQTCHSDFYTIFFKYHIFLHPIIFKSIIEHLLIFCKAYGIHSIPIHVTDHHFRECITTFHCMIHHIGKTFCSIVKFVISKSCYFYSQIP